MNYQIEVFCDSSLNSNTYLLFNDAECILIDPSNNPKIVNRYIGDRKIVGILLTHGHYDHFRTIKDFLNDTIHIVIHKEAVKKLRNPLSSCAVYFNSNFALELPQELIINPVEGKIIELGSFKIKPYVMKGHTDCSTIYQINNDLFVGDVLFYNTCGRTDLPTGNSILMMESLKRFKNFGLDTKIYPGHDDSFLLKEALLVNPYLKK